LQFEASPRKKFIELLCINSWEGWHAPVILVTWEAEIGRILVAGPLNGKNAGHGGVCLSTWQWKIIVQASWGKK
jgi:hypothetical protein